MMSRMANKTPRLWLVLLAGSSIIALTAKPAQADPTYGFLTTIGIPTSADNNTPNRDFVTFDISSFDPTTQLDYLGDRSNAAVDIFSAKTNSYVGRIGGTGHLFSGQTASNDTSGPDGVIAVIAGGQHQVFAGNGDSTLKAFSTPSNTLLASTMTGPPSANRVDELAFDPKTNQVLAANNSASPAPFATLIDATTHAVVKQIIFDGSNGTPVATNGIEQPAYNPVTNSYFVSVPQIGASGPGGVAEVAPDGSVVHIYDFSNINGIGLATCSPTGMAVSNGGGLLVGCGSGNQTVLLNPTANGGAGSIKTVGIGGEDQVAYSTTNNLFFVPAYKDPNGAVLGVIDATSGLLVQSLMLTPGDHSVAVDPVSGEAFVPFAGVAGNTVCAVGCIGVYAPLTAVPEPGSMALLATGLLGLVGLGRLARSRA